MASVEKATVKTCVLLRIQMRPPAPNPDAYYKSDWPCHRRNLATIKPQMPTILDPLLFKLREACRPYVRLCNTKERAAHVCTCPEAPVPRFQDPCTSRGPEAITRAPEVRCSTLNPRFYSERSLICWAMASMSQAEQSLHLIVGLNPEARRSLPRVDHACQRCRAKKAKCDQQQPCRNCVKHSIDCEYGIRRRGGRRKQLIARDGPLTQSPHTPIIAPCSRRTEGKELLEEPEETSRSGTYETDIPSLV